MKFNVYNTRKEDNLILKDLEGPETNIPLPQLADTIRREGVKLYDKRRKPEHNASTLMELYREGVKGAADARNWRTKIVTLDETSKSRQAGTRKSELRKLARKTDSQVEVED